MFLHLAILILYLACPWITPKNPWAIVVAKIEKLWIMGITKVYTMNIIYNVNSADKP